MIGNVGEENRRIEALKLYFEFFKHFTTLTATVAVLFVALYQAPLNVNTQGTIEGVIIMGIALLLSLVGLFTVMWKVTLHTGTQQRELGIRLFLLMLGVMVVFLAGLNQFVVGTLRPESTFLF